MKILVIGGTKFLGRHLVDAAVSSGHEVTLFNRGKTNPHLFPEVEKLRGDRNENLDLLKHRRWDAVIDTCGLVSSQVRAVAETLANSVDHYTFLSSVSVYRDFGSVGQDEFAPIATSPMGILESESDGKTYGAGKALCEQAVECALPGRTLNIRPGIIVGPHDSTCRFVYWVCRVARGGEILCPAPPDAPLQIIDARDLAKWIIRLIETRTTGSYNATGPTIGFTFQQMLQACRKASDGRPQFVWVDEQFLLEHNVGLPLWIPKTEKDYAGFFTISSDRAAKAGLVCRSLEETARDVLASTQNTSMRLSGQDMGGLSESREAELLQIWKDKTS